jgi:hypothetical protein
MKRISIAPRPGWQEEVERAGLLWHTADGQPYWNESAYYLFTADQIDEIEAATAELQALCLEAGQFILDRDHFAKFGIPAWTVPFIRRAWDEEPPALFHGRFDLGYDGRTPPKLFEYNCDTPTALFEAAVVQWDWKEAVLPRRPRPLHPCRRRSRGGHAHRHLPARHRATGRRRQRPDPDRRRRLGFQPAPFRRPRQPADRHAVPSLSVGMAGQRAVRPTHRREL